MDFEDSSPEDMRIYIAALEAELQLERQRRQSIEDSTFWKLSQPLRQFLTPIVLYRRQIARDGWRSLLRRSGRTHPPARSFLVSPFSDGAAFAFLSFDWAHFSRPCDVSDSTDSRRLAAGFKNLQILGADGSVLVDLDFRQSGNAKPQTCYGFSYGESWGNWSAGLRSVLLVWLPSALQGKLTLRLEASLPEGLSSNKATIAINDHAVGDLILNGVDIATLDFKIEPGTLDTRIQPAKENVSNDPAATPAVSVIILNYNKPFITYAAVRALQMAVRTPKFEVIVLDNGSNSDTWRVLRAMNLPARVIRLKHNRYFGEGNNIAAETARADVLLFLNNDAFVQGNAVADLYDALLGNPDAGATGPVFRYPDGELQEAGAFLTSNGTAFQRGKATPEFDCSKLKPVEPVDYISAACLAIRRQDFIGLGGFDLRYDPAYYEDSDLCLRLMAKGKKTLLVKSAVVTHIENATTADPANAGIAQNIVERHQQIFLNRWKRWLVQRTRENLPAVIHVDVAKTDLAVKRGQTSSPINAVYTPFPLVPGGGERYLLGTALALNVLRPTAVVTPDEYSNCRVNTLMNELGYPTGELYTEVERRLAHRDVDTFVLMGNEAFPTREGYGERRIFHCQFPFPSDYDGELKTIGIKHLAAYDMVVVNSRFTAQAYINKVVQHTDSAIPVQVVYPPVRTLTGGVDVGLRSDNVLSIGRFTPHGHAKRQDVILQAFKTLVKSGALQDWALHLCGSVPNDKESLAYFDNLKKQAEGFNVHFSISPSREEVEALLQTSRVYVSATGFGVEKEDDYWLCEHFGITVVEAASAGCIPVGYHIGGPAEIIERLGVGHTFRSVKDLQNAILAAAADSTDAQKISMAVDNSQYFDESRFFAEWSNLLASQESSKWRSVGGL